MNHWLEPPTRAPVLAMEMVPSTCFNWGWEGDLVAIELLPLMGKTASLNHKIINDPVKAEPVIKTLVCKLDKVTSGLGRFVFVQFNAYGAVTGLDDSNAVASGIHVTLFLVVAVAENIKDAISHGRCGHDADHNHYNLHHIVRGHTSLQDGMIEKGCDLTLTLE